MEDNLKWKATLDGRRLLMEDYLQLMMFNDGSLSLIEDDLGWRTDFGGGQLLMEDSYLFLVIAHEYFNNQIKQYHNLKGS